MSISLIDVAGANFRTDEKSEKLNDQFRKRLGMGARYLPARLAIARSLAITGIPAPLPEGHHAGKIIKGDTLFGAGTTLSVWLGLIIEHAQRSDLDTKELIALVGAHWRRGLERLDKEWGQAGQDMLRFIERLVEIAGLPAGGAVTASPDQIPDNTFSSGQIEVPIGEISEEVATKEKSRWSLNGPGGSPHSAIMGGVGSGKTRTAVAMLSAIREQTTVPLLAFDFKGDLGTDASGNGYHIDQLFEAQTLEPPRTPIPLDVLTLRSQDDIDIDAAAMRFRESFSRLKGSRLGDKQRATVYEAASEAIRNEAPCRLEHILNALKNIYTEREIKEDGALATMQEICRFPLFEPGHSAAEFFQRSWIIKLPPNVAQDSRTMVVNLLLDALDQYLNSLADAETNADGARGLRILCMIDEAHQILGTKLPSLSNLIRMSRSKGGAIILISQSPNDFSGEDDEFLSEMGLVAAFSTNAAPRHAARILGNRANLGALQTGQCFIKRRNLDNTARKIRAWE